MRSSTDGTAARPGYGEDVEDHAHARIDALHRRIGHLEDRVRRVHEHVGLGPMPERPAPLDHELEPVRRLLSQGREAEAVQLHRDLTGQAEEQSREALRSLTAGL